MPANASTVGNMRLRLTRISGNGESIRIIDPKARLRNPPAVSSPKLVTLISSTSRSRPKTISKRPT